MIPEIVVTISLLIPIIPMMIPSINYWRMYRKDRGGENKSADANSRKANYNKPLFGIFILGVLGMWFFWIVGIILSLLNSYQVIFGVSMFLSDWDIYIQSIGLGFFFLGGIGYNWVLRSAGKYVQPAPSGALEEHKLVTTGPFGVVRHPLYVSYFIILVGLLFTLLTYWIVIPLLFLLIGIRSTARAEEIVLVELFGESYEKYQLEVGMLFPRIGRN
jgi:protein-S-isoprenylcysteine O-methyltransferase Ste14